MAASLPLGARPLMHLSDEDLQRICAARRTGFAQAKIAFLNARMASAEAMVRLDDTRRCSDLASVELENAILEEEYRRQVAETGL